jgi:hypothetical protein
MRAKKHKVGCKGDGEAQQRHHNLDHGGAICRQQYRAQCYHHDIVLGYQATEFIALTLLSSIVTLAKGSAWNVSPAPMVKAMSAAVGATFTNAYRLSGRPYVRKGMMYPIDDLIQSLKIAILPIFIAATSICYSHHETQSCRELTDGSNITRV